MSAGELVHRIELREGSADPTVLELLPGESVGPIDLGTDGHWRVVAAGVTDSHAYLFFDGEKLFLQSADPAAPVIVNGLPVPDEWMAVEAPCEIAIGEALLWFDAAGDDVGSWDTPAPGLPPHSVPGYVPPGPGAYPPAQAPTSNSGGYSSPGYASPGSQSSPGYSSGGYPAPSASSPGYSSGSYPQPSASSPGYSAPGSGGYAPPGAPDDDGILDEDSDPDPFGDATNVVPVHEFMARTSATRRAALAQLLNLPAPGDASQPGPTSQPSAPSQPAASRPGPDRGTAATKPLLDLPDLRGAPHSGPTATVPLGAGAARGFDQPVPPSSSQPGFGAPGEREQMDHLQVLPPGNDPAAETAKTNAALTSKWASMSFPQKATAFLFLPMVLSVLVLFTDIVPTANNAAPTGKAPTPPGSSALTTPSATLSDTGPDSTALAASDAVPDPDPEVEPPAPSASEVADSDAPAAASAEPDEPAEEVEDVPKGEKSKQRQAVDALASGSYAEATRLYEELAKKYPQNKAYAAAAAITRAKVEVEK